MTTNVLLDRVIPPRAERPTCITGATVVPMTKPVTVPDQTVVVDDGVIVALGNRAEVPVPDDARVVEGRNRYLMPGLADMHAHYGDPGQFAMFLAGGVTTIRNMWGSPFHLATRAAIEAGTHPGPHINTTGPITDRPVADGRGIYPGTTLIENPADAADIVAEVAAAGYDAVKVYSYLTPDCLHALGRAAGDHGLPMVGHCPTTMSFEQAMDAGMTSFEHFLEVGRAHLHGGAKLPPLGADIASHFERMRVEIEFLDREAVRRLGGELAARRVWNCPTITALAQFSIPPAEALAHEGMQYVGKAASDLGRRRAERFSDMPRQLGLSHVPRQALELSIEMVGLLHAEGAPLLLGTDSGSPLTPQGFTVADELEYFSQAGLSWFDVISAGTTATAAYLGQRDRGTLEVGKRADLVLVDRDPTIDPAAAMRSISAVFNNGFVFERSALDALLEWRKATVDAMVDLDDDQLGPMATRTWYER